MTNRLLLASHGELARGLRDAALLIMGERDDIFATAPYSGDIDALLAETRAVLDGVDGILVVLTDLEGGSPHNALLPLTTDARVRVISGANLPLVIAIALDLPDLDADSSFGDAIDEARAGLRSHVLLGPDSAPDEEDF
ncbi:PTS sugar transporter subunit IIA [Microbacterium aurugineum]|uniref:PTS sugar transporter subunit IIA n=1 Tax=Microbacterium aurugineum TaxID=2851642 RepID=UPI0020BE59EE|nr:hypothetical protein [Microbacterium aurugineum]MCK8478291.1 hypothetical protein [Microbacterium aurugineum]